MTSQERTTAYQFMLRTVDGPSGQTTVRTLELAGEIDASNAEELDHALGEHAGSIPLILDLSAAEFFDSAGFAVLDRRLAGGGLLVVISSDSLIRRAASLINVPFHDSVNDALAAIADG